MDADKGGKAPEERREYFRIDDEAVLDYRVISAAELPELQARIGRDVPDRFNVSAGFAATSRQVHRLLHKVSHDSPELARCLEALDGKLNTLAQLLLADEVQTRGEHAQAVSLSAGGLGFHAAAPIAAGDLLEIRLVLVPAYTGLFTVGRVAYCEERAAEQPDYPWYVAVEFDRLRPADQELLVAHVLRRQGAQRRGG